MGIIKDPTSWRTGFELGLAGFSFPYSKPRKPAAYLYNGIRLPALPEWDRGKYPYAMLYHYFFGSVYLCVSKDPWVGTGELYDADYPKCGEKIVTGSSCIYFESKTCWGDTNLTDDIWVEVDTSVKEVTTVWGQMFDDDGDGIVDRGTQCAFWSNHNIISADGNTVLIAASEPVPVYG